MRNQHFEVAPQALVAHWLEFQLGVMEKVATSVRWGAPFCPQQWSLDSRSVRTIDSSDPENSATPFAALSSPVGGG